MGPYIIKLGIYYRSIYARKKLTMADKQNNKNAIIELQHIELELKNNRTQHLRHFVDQYYCYKNNHVNKNGRAKWEGIVWKDLVSEEASKISDRKNVVKEHIVPLKVITEILVNHSKEKAFNIQTISELLDRYVRFATITKCEDKLLRNAKLISTMPKEFWVAGHSLHNDLLARYKNVGITLVNSEN